MAKKITKQQEMFYFSSIDPTYVLKICKNCVTKILFIPQKQYQIQENHIMEIFTKFHIERDNIFIFKARELLP